MSDYQIQETTDGGFVIVQLQPVEIAGFAERELAERALVMLLEDEAAKAGPEPEVVPRPKAEAAEPEEDFRLEDVWTEAELDAAILQLLAGRKIKDVAADFGSCGKSWRVLRGAWARYRRTEKEEEETDPEEAPNPLISKCTVCNKAFVASIDKPDLCARCRNA